MTALKIILIILAVLLLLMLFPIRITVDYDGQPRVGVGYLFLKFQIVPPKEKKPPRKKKPPKKPEKEPDAKKTQEKKPGTLRRLMDRYGLDGLIEILKDIVKIVVGLLGGLGKHLYFTRFRVRICIVGEDAADTAVKYGYVCSAVYPLVAVLREHSVLKNPYTDISAGFLAEKTAAELELTAKIRPLFLVGLGLKALFGLIKSVLLRKPS